MNLVRALRSGVRIRWRARYDELRESLREPLDRNLEPLAHLASLPSNGIMHVSGSEAAIWALVLGLNQKRVYLDTPVYATRQAPPHVFDPPLWPARCDLAHLAEPAHLPLPTMLMRSRRQTAGYLHSLCRSAVHWTA